MCNYLSLIQRTDTVYSFNLWGGKHSKLNLFEFEARKPAIRVNDKEKEIIYDVFMYLHSISECTFTFYVGHTRDELTHIMLRYISEAEYCKKQCDYDFNYYYVMIAGLEAILETNLIAIA